MLDGTTGLGGRTGPEATAGPDLSGPGRSDDPGSSGTHSDDDVSHLGDARPEVVTLEVDAAADALGRARRLARVTLRRWGLDLLIDDVALVVTELATNALLHGRPPIRVHLHRDGDGARLEVADRSSARPLEGIDRADAMTGRGLALVATLAADWGVRAVRDGKIVWCRFAAHGVAGRDDPSSVGATTAGAVLDGQSLDGQSLDSKTLDRQALDGQALDGHTLAGSARAGPALGGPVWGDAGRDGVAPATSTSTAPVPLRTGPLYEVRLGDVPTDLLLEAKAHVDSLAREFALAAAGEASGSTGAVPPDMIELITRVVGNFATARQAIKRQAVEAARRGDSRTGLVLWLPAEAADAGEVYLDGLEQVDRYCRAARLLTLETPPQHRVFRHWYVENLVTSLRRAAAGEPPLATQTLEARLLAELGSLTRARRLDHSAARLQRHTAALAATRTSADVADVVRTEVVPALHARSGALLVRDGDGLALLAGGGLDAPTAEALLAASPTEPLPVLEALRTGQPVWIESGRERNARYPRLAELDPALAALCAIPLTAAGEVHAVLRLGFAQPRLFDDQERDFVLTLAGQTAQALYRAHLSEAERSARREAELLADRLSRLQTVTAALAAASDVRAVGEVIVHHTLSTFGAARSSVCLLVGDDALEIVASGGYDPPLEHSGWTRIQLATDLPVTEAARSRQTVVVRGREGRRRFAALARIPGGKTFGVVAVPLQVGRRLIGSSVTSFPADRPLGPAEVSFLTALADLCAQALDRARLYERERDTAEVLQHSLLPDASPSIPGLSVATRYRPAGADSEVGGDWYDVVTLPHDRVGLAIGDVAGHGVHAAAVMGQLRSALRAYALQGGGAGEVLGWLNEAAVGMGHEVLATAVFGTLDPSTGELCVASAGHPPLLALSGGRVRALGGDANLPLGVQTGTTFQESSFTLRTGDVLVGYTDGLVERRGLPIGEGIRQLSDALTASADTDPEAVAERLLSAGPSDDRTTDDAALVVVRLDAVPAPPFEATLTGRRQDMAVLRARLAVWLRRIGVVGEDAAAVTLAACEAVTNAVGQRTDDGPVRVSGRLDVPRAEVGLHVHRPASVGPPPPGGDDSGSDDSGNDEADGVAGLDRARGLLVLEALTDSTELRRSAAGGDIVLRRRVRIARPE